MTPNQTPNQTDRGAASSMLCPKCFCIKPENIPATGSSGMLCFCPTDEPQDLAAFRAALLASQTEAARLREELAAAPQKTYDGTTCWRCEKCGKTRSGRGCMTCLENELAAATAEAGNLRGLLREALPWLVRLLNNADPECGICAGKATPKVGGHRKSCSVRRIDAALTHSAVAGEMRGDKPASSDSAAQR